MKHTCARPRLAFALASAMTLTSIAILSGPPAASACPPAPTFSEILGMSDLIVTGTVGAIEKKSVKINDEAYEFSVGTIHVADVLKGAATRGQSLRVSHIDASDFERVANGDSVETDDATEPVPLSMRTGLFLISGPHAEDPDSPSPFSRMRVFDITENEARDGIVPIVRDYVAIEAIADEVKRRTALFEWIVKCAENPQTRRDGLYEFSRADDERTWRAQADDVSYRDSVIAKVAFTDSQIDRLLTVWLERLEKRDESTMWFGNALGEHRAEVVATRLLDLISAEGDGTSSDVGTWMTIVASTYKWRSGHLLAQKLWESEDAEERAALVRRFLELAPLRGEIPEAIESEDDGEEDGESIDDFESPAINEMEEIEREAVEAIGQAGVEVDPDGEVLEVYESHVNVVELNRPDDLNKP